MMRPAHTQAFVDHPGTIAAMLWAGIAGAYSTVVMPLIVGAVATSRGLAPAAASSVAASEMGGVALGSLIATPLVVRLDRSRLVLIAAFFGVVANLTSPIVDGLTALLAMRFLAGCACGMLLAAMAAGVGGTTKVERNFGIFVAAAFLLATASFNLLPPLVSEYGESALFWTLAAAAAVTVVTAWRFPRGASTASVRAAGPSPAAVTPWSLSVYVALGAIFAYYLGVGAVWPLMERVGVERGAEAAAVSATLALASTAAMGGALLAASVGGRLARGPTIVAGLALVAVSLTWLAESSSEHAVAYGPVLMLAAWNFTVPFMMSAVAVLDTSGRAVAFNMTLQYVGFSVGPLIAALLARAGSVTPVVWFSATAVATSLVLFAFALMRRSVDPAAPANTTR